MKMTIKWDKGNLIGNAKVLDENGLLLFSVKSKLFSITRKKKIYDNQKKLLYVIRNKFWKFIFKKAYIYENKKKIAKVIRKISVKSNFRIEGFEKPVRIDGQILGIDYKIIVDEKEIASIKRASISTVEFDVADESDAGIVIAIFCAINNIICQD